MYAGFYLACSVFAMVLPVFRKGVGVTQPGHDRAWCLYAGHSQPPAALARGPHNRSGEWKLAPCPCGEVYYGLALCRVQGDSCAIKWYCLTQVLWKSGCFVIGCVFELFYVHSVEVDLSNGVKKQSLLSSANVILTNYNWCVVASWSALSTSISIVAFFFSRTWTLS